MKDIFFRKKSSPFLSVLLDSFSIRTVKIVIFLVFFLEQVNFEKKFPANSFMIK